MGKGRIITAHGEGRYTIELLEDRARADAARALAVERLAALDTRISELETDLAQAQAEVDSAAGALDQAIAAYQAEIQAEGESDIDTTTPATELQEAAAKRDAIAGNIRGLKVERLAAQRRIDLIDALPPLRQQEAWCADYTEDLSGEVATAEVPGEATHVQLRPGYNGAATYDQARDGALQLALSGTPAGVFYNLAMLPGWQKWRPTYRIATITSIDLEADTCAIDIEPASSSQQGLNVNAQASYVGVPVQYMTCNAGAFEEGDRVLVRFDTQDPDVPSVIGFESSPRPCAPSYAVAHTFTPFLPHPAGIDSYTWEPGPDEESACSGASIVFDDTHDPSIRWLGTAGGILDVLQDDVPIAQSQSTAGEKYQVTFDLQFVTSGYSASTAGNRCVATLTATATIEEGEPLAEVCVATLRSVVDAGNTFACSTADYPKPLTATPVLHDMQSVIEIDTYSFDLESIGIRVANTYLYAQLDSDPSQDFVWANQVGFLADDEYGIEVDKDRRGVFYIAALFESAPMTYAHDPADGLNDLRDLIQPMTAAFMKAPDGTMFRVQARGVAAENQVPDYASLPTDIEQDEMGNWVAV